MQDGGLGMENGEQRMEEGRWNAESGILHSASALIHCSSLADQWLLFAACCLFLFFPSQAFGGTIRTTVTSNYTVMENGDIAMDFLIRNEGDATAFNTMAVIFIGDRAEKVDNLGNNPPGGKISFKTHCPRRDLKPGKYTAILRIGFQDEGGKPYLVYQFSELPYLIDLATDKEARLSLELIVPTFNKKALWNPRETLGIKLKNDHSAPIKASVFLCLPDGFSTRAPNTSYDLSAGEERTEEMTLTMYPAAVQDPVLRVVAYYEHNNKHHSRLVESMIGMEERAVLWKWFIVIAALVLVGSFAVARKKAENQKIKG